MKGIVACLLGKENLLDHLGIFAKMYQIPLKVFDPSLCTIAETYYPDLSLKYCDFSPSHFDPSIYPWILCGTLACITPLKEAQMRYFGKTSSFAYLSHGISAKSRTLKKEEMPEIDLFLFPGKALQELIHECGLGDCYRNFLYTGNFRAAYFKKHQIFYNHLVQKGNLDSTSTLVLMPSYSGVNNPSFFFDLNASLLQKLETRYSIIIKPHPLLEEERPGFFWHLKGLCEDMGISFLEKAPLILPYLNEKSLLVTDTSSVVFDGLAQGAKIAILRKDLEMDRYDLSDEATRISDLKQLLEKDFEIRNFDPEFIHQKLEWLYSPVLKKADLATTLQVTLQSSLQ